MNPELKEIECAGTPMQMGVQYGELARDEIRANHAKFYERPAAEAPRTVDAMCGLIARVLPEVLEELRGVSEGSGVSLGGLVLANQFVNPDASVAQGCTSMAVPRSPDWPVLGKNNDGHPDDLHFVVRRSRPTHGLAMIQVTVAGWLCGLDAINARGLANSHNSVGSRFDKSADAVDVRLWAYRQMRECETSDAFVRAMNRAKLTGKGYNIIVADPSGDTRVLEAALPAMLDRGRGEPFIYATNHYLCGQLCDADMRPPRAKDVSVYRLGYLSWLDQTDRPTCERQIRDTLRSHSPWAPCRHGGPHMDHTLWSMIAMPKARSMHIAHGAPCAKEYKQYGFA